MPMSKDNKIPRRDFVKSAAVIATAAAAPAYLVAGCKEVKQYLDAAVSKFRQNPAKNNRSFT